MSKWFGAIGFSTTSETKPGVWQQTMEEKNYFGDVTRNVRRMQTSSGVNDDVNISNQLSIVSDTYAMEHMQNMVYAVWMNQKWKITSVEVQYPRLNLELGGVWNG